VYTAARDNPYGGGPAETAAGLEGTAKLQAVLEEVTGKADVIRGASYWSELPILWQGAGIPGVYCSPGDITNCHTLDERVSKAELVDGVRAFGLLMLDLCGAGDAATP